MILGMTYYQIAMYFLIYSFGGWCLEVVYHAVKQGRIINRGFLNGPVCPVYGFGMLAVIGMVHFLPQNETTGQYNVLAVFFGGMLLTTAIELIAGYILYHLFHARWWDYSKQPFNIGGYICPLFSIFWGIACVLVVRYLHPLVEHSAVESIPDNIGWPIMTVLYLLYLIDFIVTILTAAGLDKELNELDRLRKTIRRSSDALTDIIGGTSLHTAQAAGEARVQAALAKDEMREAARGAELAAGEAVLNAKETMLEKKDAKDLEAEKAAEELLQERDANLKRYEAVRNDLLEHPYFGKTRLLNAFPGMQHARHNDLVKDLQQKLQKKHS